MIPGSGRLTREKTVSRVAKQGANSTSPIYTFRLEHQDFTPTHIVFHEQCPHRAQRRWRWKWQNHAQSAWPTSYLLGVIVSLSFKITFSSRPLPIRCNRLCSHLWRWTCQWGSYQPPGQRGLRCNVDPSHPGKHG